LSDYILEMRGIHKSFPGVQALKGVDLAVRPGSVHGVMGENGAGKSTLMKIAIGLYQPDAGSISLRGVGVKFADVHDALTRGISMIHQEMSPLPYMTVAQNIFLGREMRNAFGLIDHRAIDRAAEQMLGELEIKLKPRAIMGKLSVAQMQLVEIAEAVSRKADLIIMDEPTSALTEKEVVHLFSIIRGLKERGAAIIYITHKMDEVFAITDEVSVYRDGEFVGHEMSSDLTREKLIKMMVGRTIDQFFIKEKASLGSPVLEVEGLSRRGVFSDISFSVREGEILGVAGLIGAGRTEVMECLFGITPKQAGTIRIGGKPVRIESPYDAIRNGLAFLTEDRKRSGLYLNLSVRDNIIMPSLRNNLAALFIRHRALKRLCDEAVGTLSIKTPNLDQLVMYLSGGNQQKVLVSRWLATVPRLLIMDEPTRGIDVATKSEIYKLMSKLAREGKAIILISSEMPEILAMSDRIMVMHEGRKVGEIDRSEASQEKILHMATGESLSTFKETRYY
jgi:inositol transport system ATP-binding protein